MVRGGHKEEEEKRFNKCMRKYQKIVKQFDELVELMTARTKPSKRRQRVASNQPASRFASSIEADSNEVLVRTVTQFLNELKAEP